MKRRSLIFLFLFASAVFAQTTNISGTWSFDVTTSSGNGTPSFTFQQDGTKLSGTYTGLLGELPITGTVDGKTITFEMNVEAQGEKFVVRYKGTIESPDSMKGTAEYGPLGEATWTGQKKK